MGITFAEARRLGILGKIKRARVPQKDIPTRPANLAPRVFEVVLDLPPRECSSNSRHNWRAKAKAVKKYRADCCVLHRVAFRKTQVYVPVRIDLDFYLGNRGSGAYMPIDEGNAQAAGKTAQDALIDAGVIPNDSKKFVKAGPVRILSRKEEHKGRSCLVMKLIEL